MYKLFVSLRYLRRNWLNLVGVFAVTLGVWALICVLSVMKGFDQEFRSRIRATLSDVIVESWSDSTFDKYEPLIEKIESLPHVVACAPEYAGIGLIRLGKLPKFGQFHGIDLSRQIQTTDFEEYWRAWRGFSGREEVGALLATAASSKSALSTSNLGPALKNMRRKDFNQLSRDSRREVNAWAARVNFDLDAAFQAAETALPEWGSTDDPKRSPAFGGYELLLIGRGIKGDLVRMGVGDTVTIISPSLTDVFDRSLKTCQIVGQFRSGQYEYDKTNLYIPLADAQKFMGQKGRVSSINIRLDSFDNAPKVRAALLGILTPDELEGGLLLLTPFLKKKHPDHLKRLRRQLRELRTRGASWYAEGSSRPIQMTVAFEKDLLAATRGALADPSADTAVAARLKAMQTMIFDRERDAIRHPPTETIPVEHHFRISTWEDKRRTFLRALWLERRIMSVILFLVLLIAGFQILSILHTSVLRKTKDIGILKAVGGSVGGIMSIFLLNGFVIGLLGSSAGAVLGMFTTSHINEIEALLARRTGFGLFPKDIYYLDSVPVDTDPFWSVAVICVTAVVVSFLAGVYPAWKASRMDPVEALRYE